MNELILAFNRKNSTVCVLPFKTWEEAQSAFRFGIVMPDGTRVTGIGRAKCAIDELEAKVRSSSLTFIHPDSAILTSLDVVGS